MPELSVPTPPRREASSGTRAWTEVVLCLGLIAGVVVLLFVDPGEPHEPMQENLPAVEALLLALVEWLVVGAELAAAVVIGWGVIQAFGTYLAKVVQPGGDAVNSTEGLRVRLGRTLALGLELTLASDILQTAVAPGRAEVILLGIVILLRTLLNIFLEREIEAIESRQAARRSADAADVPMEEGD